MAEELAECPVCRDHYSLRIRKPIKCPACHFTCCMACMRQYILSSVTEPACMECRMQFQYEFLLEHLPSSFWHKEYKEFRKDMLLAREESRIPETQGCIVRIHRKDQFYQAMEVYRKKMDRMRRFYSRMLDRFNRMTNMIAAESRGDLVIPDDHPFFAHFDENDRPLMNEKHEMLCMVLVGGEEEETAIASRARNESVASTWLHACPRDDCRGFLRGDQNRCPLCRARVCNQCLCLLPSSTLAAEDLEETTAHECQREDLETVELLRQNTRPCPTCSMSIYKISGCDQMWCTQCRTPFSWRTGQKINQTIHNPHYYEWMQRQAADGTTVAPRELMDIPCGGLPSIHQIQLFPPWSCEWFYDLHQTIIHTEHVVLPRSQQQHQPPHNNNDAEKELRIAYLLNRISRSEWKTELYRREKVRQKHAQYSQILQTFIAVSSDWMRRMIIEQENVALHNELRQMIEFLRYINQQIIHLNHRYKSSLSLLPNTLMIRW